MMTALALGILAFLLSVVATVLRYTRHKDLDYFHLFFTLALLLFIFAVARNRGKR